MPEPEQAGGSLSVRYYAAMASAAVVVAILGILTAHLAGSDNHHLDFTWRRVFLVLIVLNLAGAYVLFAPINRLQGRSCASTAISGRVRHLATLSGLWVGAVGVLFMLPEFFEHYGASTVDATASMDAYHLMLVAVFGFLLGLYTYFLVSDYSIWLRTALHERRGIVIPAGHGHFGTRLLVAFVATSIVPVFIVVSHTHVFDTLGDTHALHMQKMLQVDLFAALVVVVIAIIFQTRYLTRPITELARAVHRVSQGNLEARALPISDDEVGQLTHEFNRMVEQLKEREYIRATLGKFAPEEVVAAVLEDRGVLKPQVRNATVLFTDIEGFVSIAERLSPDQVIELLNDYFHALSDSVHRYGGVVTQFQGDGMLVAFNMPVVNSDHAANALRAALAIQEELSRQTFRGGLKLHTRIGVNSGSLVGGTVGDGDRIGYTVHGDTVNLAARLEQMNKRFGTRVLVSERTADLAGAGFPLVRLGAATLPGREQVVTVFHLRTKNDAANAGKRVASFWGDDGGPPSRLASVQK